MSALPRPIQGIIPPMVTPLVDRDTIDVAGLERLVERIVSAGVGGLFVLGTTGEAPSLSYRLRRELIDRTCEAVDRRVPVLVGVTDTSFVESINLAEEAADSGADAVVLSAPYYFPAGQEELLEYVEHIAGELPLPVFLYNMPSHTKVTFEPETIRRAIEIPNVVGLKDSSANMIYFHHVRRIVSRRPDFSLLIGPEELLAEATAAGGHGGVSGGANLHPRLYVELCNAAARRDLDRVEQLHDQVMQIVSTIYRVGRHGSSIIKGIKCALSVLGVCDDFMAEPFHRFRTEERLEIQSHLDDLGITAEDPAPVR